MSNLDCAINMKAGFTNFPEIVWSLANILSLQLHRLFYDLATKNDLTQEINSINSLKIIDYGK